MASAGAELVQVVQTRWAFTRRSSLRRIRERRLAIVSSPEVEQVSHKPEDQVRGLLYEQKIVYTLTRQVSTRETLSAREMFIYVLHAIRHDFRFARRNNFRRDSLGHFVEPLLQVGSHKIKDSLQWWD